MLEARPVRRTRACCAPLLCPWRPPSTLPALAALPAPFLAWLLSAATAASILATQPARRAAVAASESEATAEALCTAAT